MISAFRGGRRSPVSSWRTCRLPRSPPSRKIATNQTPGGSIRRESPTIVTAARVRDGRPDRPASPGWYARPVRSTRHHPAAPAPIGLPATHSRTSLGTGVEHVLDLHQARRAWVTPHRRWSNLAILWASESTDNVTPMPTARRARSTARSSRWRAVHLEDRQSAPPPRTPRPSPGRGRRAPIMRPDGAITSTAAGSR